MEIALIELRTKKRQMQKDLSDLGYDLLVSHRSRVDLMK